VQILVRIKRKRLPSEREIFLGFALRKRQAQLVLYLLGSVDATRESG
jgi:hypothetical protein